MKRIKKLGPSPSQRMVQCVEEAKDMAAHIRDKVPAMPGKNAMVLCARVGTLVAAPPRDEAELMNCVMCGHGVWIMTRTREAVEAKGMKVKAVCISGCDWRSTQEGGVER